MIMRSLLLGSCRRLHTQITASPTKAALGAFIYDFDFAAAHASYTSETVEYLNQRLLEHQVLIFRNTTDRATILSDEQLVRFTECFGEPEVHRAKKGSCNALQPEVYYVSNVERFNSQLGCDAIAYHSDLSYMPPDQIGRVGVLHAVELKRMCDGVFVDECGECEWAKTYFMDTYATYSALDEEMRRKLETYKAMARSYETSEELNPSKSLVFHDVVQKHSITQRKTLNISPIHTHYLRPDDPELYDYLVQHNCKQPQFEYEHRWKIGDLVLYDNECTMHSREAFDGQNHRRVLKRTQIYGDNTTRYIPRSIEHI